MSKCNLPRKSSSGVDVYQWVEKQADYGECEGLKPGGCSPVKMIFVLADVRFWSLADIHALKINVHFQVKSRHPQK